MAFSQLVFPWPLFPQITLMPFPQSISPSRFLKSTARIDLRNITQILTWVLLVGLLPERARAPVKKPPTPLAYVQMNFRPLWGGVVVFSASYDLKVSSA